MHQPTFTGPIALWVGAALLALALTGCGRQPHHTARWDGRRGYDGNGDYGYDPDAPREAAVFETRAGQSYPAPGPLGDPWSPYTKFLNG